MRIFKTINIGFRYWTACKPPTICDFKEFVFIGSTTSYPSTRLKKKKINKYRDRNKIFLYTCMLIVFWFYLFAYLVRKIKSLNNKP